MAKKQVTMQLSQEVIDALNKESKRTKKPKQVVIDEHLKRAYGL